MGPGAQVVRVNGPANDVERGLVALGATLGDRRLHEIGHRDCVASADDLQVLTARRTHDVRRGAEQVRILLGQVAGAGNLDELRQATLLRLVGVEQTGRRALGLQTDGFQRCGAGVLTDACRFHQFEVLSGDAHRRLMLAKFSHGQLDTGAFFQPSIRVLVGDAARGLVDGEVVHSDLGRRRKDGGDRTGVVGQLGGGDTGRHAESGETCGENDRHARLGHEKLQVRNMEYHDMKQRTTCRSTSFRAPRCERFLYHLITLSLSLYKKQELYTIGVMINF